MIGTISAWGGTRRCGYISTGEGPDFLFLPSGLNTPVSVGNEVKFSLEENPDGTGSPKYLAVDVAVRVAQKPGPASTRLFVGNLPVDVERRELVRALETAGPVLQVLQKPGWDYAFVDFANPSICERVLRGMVTVELVDRKLRFKPVNREVSNGY